MRVWTAVATGVILAVASGGPGHKADDADAGDPPEPMGKVAQLTPDDLVGQVTRATQDNRFARFSISLRPRSGGSPSADVTGAYRFTRPYGVDVTATITAPDRDGENRPTGFIASGEHLYFKPADRNSWVRFDRDDDVAATAYVRPLVLEIARALDAVPDWRMFAAAAKLHDAGVLTDGTREHGYHAAINVGKALRGTTDGTHAMLVDIHNRGVPRIGYTVWINDRTKLPRQAQVGMEYRGRTVDVKADYSAWGKPVTISVPPEPTVPQ